MGAADLDKVQADFDALVKAREDAGIDYLLAVKNATGGEVTAGAASITALGTFDTDAGILQVIQH